MARVRLGDLLVEAQMITREQLDEVLTQQKSDKRRLGTLLVESGLVTETQVTQILSQQLAVPWVSLYHIDFSRQLLNLVPHAVAERHCLVPIFVRRVRGLGETLYVAMDDPTNEAAIEQVKEYAGLPVRAMIAPPSDILAAIRVYYGKEVQESGSDETTMVVQAPAARKKLSPPPKPGRAKESTSDAPPPEDESDGENATEAETEADEPQSETPADEQVAASEEARPADAAVERPLSEIDSAEPTPKSAELQELAPPRPPEPSGYDIEVEMDEPGRAAPATEPAETLVSRDSSADDLREPAEVPTDSAPPEPTSDADPEPIPEPEHDTAPDSLAGPAPPKSYTPSPESSRVAAREASMPQPKAGKPGKMVSLTLLDGTTITLPAKGKQAMAAAPKDEEEEVGDQVLTARDLVAALRAVSHGADATEILGENVRWEAMFAALLSLLLKKHLIADWEFVEEYKKV